MSISMNPAEERQAFVAARKQASLASCFKYDQGYEDALAARESNPAAFDAMSGDYRSKVLGYYLPSKLAAIAEGLDVTGGSR